MTGPAFRRRPLAAAVAASLTATLAIYASPLDAQPAVLVPVQPGCAIASLLPAELAHEVIVCRYQGLWILRKDWQRQLVAGDMVEFHVRPQGGGNNGGSVRTVLSIIVLIVAYYYAPYLVGEWGALGGLTSNVGLVQAGLIVAGNLAINALVPTAQASGNTSSGPAASPSYNVSASGNAARLDGAIPVLYGYTRTFPDFAAQPYYTYENDDQYLHILMALGHGEHTVIRPEIDDTSLSTFGDVEFYVRGPGVAPTLVNPAVVTAPEVTGQELKPGRWVGGFAASAAGYKATHLGVDLVFGGLGVINDDGSIAPKTVGIIFQAREVDDWGAPVGAWFEIGFEDVTEATADTVRRSFYYAMPTPGRYLARAVRPGPKDESRQVANTPLWAGLRAYLEGAAPLEPSVTHIELRMRASEQLNALTQRKISITSLRKVYTWNPDTGYSADPVETRNPAWVLLDKWRSTVYGDGLPDSRMDLASLYQFAQTCDERQDRCDVVFDQFTDSDTADRLIANCGRAKVIRRQGVRTVVRDEQADLPVTAYSARMIRPGSWGMNYGLSSSESPDGLILEYFSNRVWDWVAIECPAPGRTYTDPTADGYDAGLPMMSRPIRQRILGVTGETHAKREGLYMAARLLYRRNVVSWSTELQGVLPAYGSAVILAPALPTWGQSGDVVSWDAGTKAMGLTEPVDFVGGTTYGITIQRDDGSVTDSITVTAGDDAYTVILAEAPDFDMVLDAADRERPKYIFGAVTVYRRIARMLAIEPSSSDDGTPQFNLTAVIEDDRVHTADEALLPTGATVQDAINLDPIEAEPGGGGGDGGGSTLLLTSLTGLTLNEPSVGSALARYELLANGQVRQTTYPSGSAVRGSEWLIIAPTTTTDTSLFEARATVTAGALTAGTAGTWQALGTTSLWEVANTTADSTLTATLTIELRAIAAAGTILQSVTVVLIAQVLPEPGG